MKKKKFLYFEILKLFVDALFWFSVYLNMKKIKQEVDYLV